MKRLSKISFQDSFNILCLFEGGEERVLDLKKVIKDQYKSKILDPETFPKAQIGIFGEIFWENIGVIKNLKGESEACNYDISPEYAYMNSKPTNSQLTSS